MAKQKHREVLEADRTGAFDMNIVADILEIKDIAEAKNKAIVWLKAVDNARPENIQKAISMVNNSTSVKKLAISISNFILAFQGLAVVK
jgi:hypothetical protein